MKTLIPLKCDFHVHYIELMSKDPEAMIDKYYALEYDCIVITEHDQYMDEKMQHKLIKYAKTKYGDKLLVGFGEELTFWDNHKRGFSGGDILGLFIHSKINYEKHNCPERTITEIHKQGGLAISAHDARSNLKTGTGGLWGIRKELDLDGFEIISASGLGIAGESGGLTHPEEAVTENYICLGNSDAHDLTQLENNKYVHTTIYAYERSLAAVREALELRRIVAVCGEHCFGKEKWTQQCH